MIDTFAICVLTEKTDGLTLTYLIVLGVLILILLWYFNTIRKVIKRDEEIIG